MKHFLVKVAVIDVRAKSLRDQKTAEIYGVAYSIKRPEITIVVRDIAVHSDNPKPFRNYGSASESPSNDIKEPKIIRFHDAPPSRPDFCCQLPTAFRLLSCYEHPLVEPQFMQR